MSIERIMAYLCFTIWFGSIMIGRPGPYYMTWGLLFLALDKLGGREE